MRAVGIGRATVKARAFGVDDEPQSERRDHRAGGRDFQNQRYAGRCNRAQLTLKPALLGLAVRNRGDRNPVCPDRYFRPLQPLQRLKAKADRGPPAFGGGVIGGFKHVGQLDAGCQRGCRLDKCCFRQAAFAGRFGHQADQLDTVFGPQHLNRKVRCLDRRGRGHVHPVTDARAVDQRANQIERAEPRRLVRGGAGKMHLQPVAAHGDPARIRVSQARADHALSARLDHSGRGVGHGDHHRCGKDEGQKGKRGRRQLAQEVGQIGAFRTTQGVRSATMAS